MYTKGQKNLQIKREAKTLMFSSIAIAMYEGKQCLFLFMFLNKSKYSFLLTRYSFLTLSWMDGDQPPRWQRPRVLMIGCVVHWNHITTTYNVSQLTSKLCSLPLDLHGCTHIFVSLLLVYYSIVSCVPIVCHRINSITEWAFTISLRDESLSLTFRN